MAPSSKPALNKRAGDGASPAPKRVRRGEDNPAQDGPEQGDPKPAVATGKELETAPINADALDENATFTPNTRYYFDEKLSNRLNAMNGFSNASSGCYTLFTLPIDKLEWGTAEMGGWRPDSFLTLDGKRALVWSLAEVVYTSLVSGENEGVPAPSIKFRPLLANDFDTLASIFQTKSSPAKEEDYAEDAMWASRYVAKPGTPGPKCKKFSQLYDAQEQYKDKKEMRKLDPAELKRGDVVLVESHVKRYVRLDSSSQSSQGGNSARSTPHSSPGKGNAYRKSAPVEWATYEIGLTLEAVSLLFTGSDFYDVDSASENVVF